MSESSFRESIQSNDEDAQVDLGIRVLLTQCFDEMKPFHELDEPLNTLLEVTEMQKEIFTIKQSFLQHQSIQSILMYAIKQNISPIFFRTQGMDLYYKSKKLINLLTSIILISKQKDRIEFIHRLFNVISQVLEKRSLCLPNVICEDVTIPKTKYDAIRTIEIFLHILNKILSYSMFDDRLVIQISSNCMNAFKDQLLIQYLIIKILSKCLPFSPTNSYLQFTILLNYVLNFYSAKGPNLKALQTFSDKTDRYFRQAIQNSQFNLSNYSVSILGQKLIQNLPKFRDFSNFLFLDSIFLEINKYLDLTNDDSPIISVSFITSFEFFFKNENFLQLCIKISKYNQHFTNALMNTYINTKNSKYLPYLFNIKPHFFSNFDSLNSIYGTPFYKNIQLNDFYQIISILPSNFPQKEKMVKYLKKIIQQNKPHKKCLIDLFKFAPSELLQSLQNYDFDTIYQVLVNVPLDFSPIKHTLINLRMPSTQHFSIISYFVVSENTDEFDEALKLIVQSKTDSVYDLYENELFLEALTLRFQSNIQDFLPDFQVLFHKNKIKVLLNIATNSVTVPYFLKETLKQLTHSHDATVIFSLMSKIPNEMLHYVLEKEKFSLSVPFFELINPNTVTVVDFHSREIRFKALYRVLHSSRLTLSNLKFDDFFQFLISSLIPVLLTRKEEQYLEDFKVLRQLGKFDYTILEHWKMVFVDCYIYLFGFTNKETQIKTLGLIYKLTSKQSTFFIEDKSITSRMKTTILLYLGHPDQTIRENMRNGLNIFVKMVRSNKNLSIDNIFKVIWNLDGFWPIIQTFSSILNSHQKQFSKELVISCLINSLEYLKEFIIPILPKLTSLIDTAMKDPSLRKICLKFWLHFIKFFSSEIIKDLFGHIISQILPFFWEFRQIILEILNHLFQLNNLTYIEIARLDYFNQYDLLSQYKQKLNDEIDRISFEKQISIINEQTKTASTSYRKELYKQLLKCLKDNLSEIDKENEKITELSPILFRQIYQETDQDLIILIARCLSILPSLQQSSFYNDKYNELEKKELIKTLIKDYLVKILEDSSDSKNHDHAAFSIQELLKKYSKLTKDKNFLNDFGAIQKVIEPFINSRFQFNSAENDTVLKITRTKNWLPEFTTQLLKIAIDNQKAGIFEYLQCVLSDSPSLTKFILPYLIKQNKSVEAFVNILKDEFDYFSHEQFDSSKNLDPLRLFFHLFDVLEQWKITPGEVHFRGRDWVSLAISNDELLAHKALECGLYLRALHHIEIHIFEHHSDISEFKGFLKQIYKNLDDPDTLRELSKSTESELYQLNEINYLQDNFDKKREFIVQMLNDGRYERALIDGQALITEELLKSAQFQNQTVELDQIIAAASIRLNKWSELEKLARKYDKVMNIEITTGKLLFFLKENYMDEFNQNLHEVRVLLSNKLKASPRCIVSILSKFRVFEDVEDNTDLSTIRLSELSIEDAEFITAIKCALMDIYHKDKKEISNYWLNLSKMSRKMDLLVKSENYCQRSKLLKNDMADYEMAKIAYTKNKKDTALSLLKSIEKNVQDDDQLSKISYTHGKWSEENKEEIDNIINMYNQSISHTKNLKTIAKCHFQLANIADQRLNSFHSSLDENPSKRTKLKFGTHFTAKEIKDFMENQITTALVNYFECIKHESSYSYEVLPRILALYFDFINKPEDDKIKDMKTSIPQISEILASATKTLREYIDKIDPGIWLNGITQLISRINQPTEKKEILVLILTIVVKHFPQPSFWHLISVNNSSRPPEERQKPFIDIWTRIKPSLGSKEIGDFQTVDKIAKALLDLCYFTTNTKEKEKPSNVICPILVSAVSDCNILMPLLSTLTYNKTKNEDIKIHKMGATVVFLNSLQKPRKIEFKDYTGRTYNYLCKQDEDLRKDMRMMEFASFINLILKNDRRCSERNLKIVTYAVICLNEKCGIIEWVNNTESFRIIVSKMLQNQGKAVDMDYIRRIYVDYDKPNAKFIEKRKDEFEKILKMYPPVLHIWFLSHFRDVNQWFNSRLLYTRSCALWSMIGYIIGLGDRHAENILLNNKTGSCVHVDFNLLFGRGKHLTVPEIVPFRLTQNIVDGFGVLKTNGCFREVSVLIMETLMAKKEKLLSVLQTFVHDPLLEWLKSTRQAVENTAKLTLKEVERRIIGMTDDKTGFLSAESLVDQLINQATDIDKLSAMYIGWQSFL